MSKHNIRLEVMNTLEPTIDEYLDKFLIPVETIWQPSDFLPNSEGPEFFNEVEEIRELCKDMEYDLWVTLVADTITEEALPTYESWLVDVIGIDQHQRGESQEENGWMKWVRAWTAEENRHGDVLNKYLYLSGRVNMKEIERTTQHLIADGFDIGTGRDPYKNFVYTSFQELATNISHKRVGQLAQKTGNTPLAKMCKIIAGDEMRHYLAYREFVKVIFNYDPSEMMIAFADMMKRKIVMPAQFMRETGGKIGDAFVMFSNAAQRLGVYTSMDYIDIMNKLLKYWDIEHINNLSGEAEKARDYLMRLPARLTRVAERIQHKETHYKFSWVSSNGVM
jgi:acyl-[acyl-carrier-protein] desaturase